MVRMFAAAGAAIVVLLLANDAVADISRGCKGTILIHTAGKSVPVATVEGRGRCKNRFRANDCRRLARGAILNCARDHFAGRARNDLPPSCTITGGGRPTAVLTWIVGPPPRLNSFQNRLVWNTCCRPSPHTTDSSFIVRVGVQGDTGCHASETIEGSPTPVQCSLLRNTTFCSAP